MEAVRSKAIWWLSKGGPFLFGLLSFAFFIGNQGVALKT